MDRYVEIDPKETSYHGDDSSFWVTIPGLPDGRPHKICHYHYTSTSVGKRDENGKLIVRMWWGAREWNPIYNPLNPMTWSWMLTPEGKRSNAYWYDYVKTRHKSVKRSYGCYSIPPRDWVDAR